MRIDLLILTIHAGVDNHARNQIALDIEQYKQAQTYRKVIRKASRFVYFW